jgi:chemotaxis family two-component system sensor kinase Cph1
MWEQIIDFVKGIFDITPWPVRWRYCQWTDFHSWLYIISDIVIFATYFTIPILILRIVKKNKLPFLPFFWLLASFVLFCAVSYVIDAIMFRYPVYKFSALMRFGTAIVSLITVLALIRILPQAFSLKTPKKIEREIKVRKKAEAVLERRNKELDETNHQLDKFVYSAVHNLRSPISTALGLAELGMESTKEESSKENFKMISESLNKLDLFIQEVIYYSKNKRLTAEYTTVNLLSEVKIIWDRLLHIDGAYDIELISNIPDEQFEIDILRTKSIIRSLLENGIRYSKQGSHEKSWVEIEIEEKNNELRIVVNDNGEGISEKNKSKVFEMFYRGSTKSTGSGLGLFLVKEMVKAKKGKIALTSAVDKGTRVEIVLPTKI